MNDQAEDLMLVYLRRIEGRLDELRADLFEIKDRLGMVEAGYSTLSRRMDRMDDRLKRIERRLDPAHNPPA